MMTRHIFLIGMPGSGKSSLGKKVASNLRLPYVDMDARIQETLGGTVTEIFERYGEEAFRTAETNTLIHLTRETPSIVSTGGGTVLRELNRTIMQNHGFIILVDRPLQEIKGDIKLDRRPLLAAKGLDEVDRLYEARIDIYRAVADRVLDNSRGYFAGVDGMERIIRSLFASI